MKKRKIFSLPVLLLVSGLLISTACTDSSSSSRSSSSTPPPVTPPAAPTYTIDATGGVGGSDGGSGGYGGYFYMYKYAGTGEMAIYSSGQADASFTMPTSTPFTGDNLLTVSSNTTIEVYDPATDTPPASGTPYTLLYPYDIGAGNVYNDSIFISDGDTDFGFADADEDPVTGIVINAGVTLTFALNGSSGTYAQIDVEDDIVNNGVLTTEDVDTSVDATTPRGDLNIDAGSYHGTGMITLNGTTAGQDGGYIDLYFDGNFTNTGAMTTAGADATDADGGDGGYIYIFADGWFANTGAMTSSGGMASGASGIGGSAGSIDLENDYGNWLNSGAVTSTGGNGIDGGGSGGSAYLYLGYVGDLYNSGNINTSGGDTVNGNAGSADYIEFYVYCRDVINSGNLTAAGGDTSDTAGNGGDGDYVYFYNDSLDDYAYEEEMNAGHMLISGNIDTSGGNAVATGTGTGGDADYVYFEIYNSERAGDTSRLALLGYTSVNTSGGDANYPGDADYIDIYSSYNYSGFPPGPIVNQAAFTAMGGNVTSGATNNAAGGSGDYVDIETDYTSSFGHHDVPISITNTGDINTSGGESNNATSSSAYGGWVFMYSFEGLTNTGNITAVGGDDRATDGGTDGYGGDGGEIELYTDTNALSNTGHLNSSGGDGEYMGGDADSIYIYGIFDVSNTGNLTADGGDADDTLGTSYGGDGNYVEMLYVGTNSGTVSCAGGAGQTPGSDDEGYVFYQRVF